MIRTQIQLPSSEHRRLKLMARRLGISMAEAARRCIAQQLAIDEKAPNWEERVHALLALSGKYRDDGGASDLGVHHDVYLDEAHSPWPRS